MEQTLVTPLSYITEIVLLDTNAIECLMEIYGVQEMA